MLYACEAYAAMLTLAQVFNTELVPTKSSVRICFLVFTSNFCTNRFIPYIP